MANPKVVLFLCTGNYYRSRFAEYLFNFLAQDKKLNWVADSRGLNLELGNRVNVGPIARHTVEALTRRQVPCAPPYRMPQQVSDADLEKAALTIALKEAEHRPLMQKLHPSFADKITYWHVHDLDVTGPEQALPEIEQLVLGLIERLKSP